MLKVELRCGCGGKVEQRGNVRFYADGVALVSMEDGAREWIGGSWTSPVETLELDTPEFHCLSCDRQQALEDLVPSVPALERATGHSGRVTR